VFALQDTRGAVEIAFTDRHGGVSDGPYASLNLAHSDGDDPDTVEENLDIAAYAFARGWEASGSNPFVFPSGTPWPRMVATMSQVHGSHVAVLHPVDVESQREQQPPVADALVTKVPGVILMVRAADCLPVLLADVERAVIGAAHAGRRGLVSGIVPSTVETMRGLGAREILAWLGPHVCGRCYEVPTEMRTQVSSVVPESYALTSWGTPALDIGKGVRAQLDFERVSIAGVSRRCTKEDEDLYSYRRQGGESGRLAGMVWIRP